MMPFPSRSTLWRLIRRYAYLLGYAGFVLATIGPIFATVFVASGWSILDPNLVQYAGMMLCLPMIILGLQDIFSDRRREMAALKDERSRPIGRVARERPRPRKLPRRSGMNRRTA